MTANNAAVNLFLTPPDPIKYYLTEHDVLLSSLTLGPALPFSPLTPCLKEKINLQWNTFTAKALCQLVVFIIFYLYVHFKIGIFTD